MPRRSRGSLRLGKPDPGSAQPSFSMEDIGFQRLYLDAADSVDLTPTSRTGMSVPDSGATFAISSVSDTADYSTATIAGTDKLQSVLPCLGLAKVPPSVSVNVVSFNLYKLI